MAQNAANLYRLNNAVFAIVGDDGLTNWVPSKTRTIRHCRSIPTFGGSMRLTTL
jgi:hypothetical protein